MIKEGWVPGSGIHHNPEEMLAIMNEKYPEQKREIMMEMVETIMTRNPDVNDMRMQMLEHSVDAIRTLDSHNKGYAALGRSPLIDDKTDYQAENTAELVAQDMKIGLDLYNSCAEYCRIYNAAKLKEENV